MLVFEAAFHKCPILKKNTLTSVVRRRKDRASDSESRGPGFDLHKRHRVVSLSKTR